MNTDSLYYQQKGLSPKEYLTIIKIKDVEERETAGGKMYLITDDQGEIYSRFEKGDSWEQHLKPGNNMGVFVKEVTKGAMRYKNIYPDITKPEPIPDNEL